MTLGPTFEEMLRPWTVAPDVRARANAVRMTDPLDAVNLYNIHWRNDDDSVRHVVLPKALTGVDAEIVVLLGQGFPTGSHKVGPAYSVLMEKTLMGEVIPGVHTLVWPSTGNFGIGGAWVGGRAGYRSLVVLPEGMSRERFEHIARYGGEAVKTPGTESNVKEIYDEVSRLRATRADVRVMNQFSEMGNYRFHYHVTGNTMVELAASLAQQGVGRGRIDAFVWAMGSAGTMAAGDRVKQAFPEAVVVGLEPVQCSTLYNNGYGSHEIQGIGDKHVTWIHNTWNMDAIMCIDDQDCLWGLRLLASDVGRKVLMSRYDADEAQIAALTGMFGISGVCHILGAIKTARVYGLGAGDVIMTAATDGVDRYPSVLAALEAEHGPLDEADAVGVVESTFHGLRTDYVQHADPLNSERWHNLKYCTWVEQQGMTVEALDAQRDPAWWAREQARVPQLDALLLAARAGFSVGR